MGQAIGASFESFKTGLKDRFSPKAWVANALTGGNYTKDRQFAARQQYYNKQQPQQQQAPAQQPKTQQPVQQPQPQQQPMQQQPVR